MATAVLTGGGTGGHIVPALALVPYLYRVFDRVIFVGSSAALDKKLCDSAGVPFFTVKSAPFSRRNILKNFSVPFALSQGIAEAKALFADEKPDVVFVKGGYCSLPAAFAARAMGIPVVVHESDMTLGLANKVVSQFAAVTLGSFPETRGVDKVVGNPLRDAIFRGDSALAVQKYGLDSRPMVLVVGGSQGSEVLNRAVREGLPKLLKKYQIVHISGNGYLGTVKRDGYIEIEYTDAIADLYAAADVVVTRGGANALAEATALGKRVICVPLPKGLSRGDQEQNANSYAERGLVRVISQTQLDSERLFSAITDILSAPPPHRLARVNPAEAVAVEVIRAAAAKKT